MTSIQISDRTLEVSPLHPGRDPNRYYLFGSPESIGVGRPLNGNTIKYFPVFIDQVLSISLIEVYVDNPESAGLARIGIYSNLNGNPNELVFDFGEFSCATAGIKQLLSPGLILDRAWYWIAAAANITWTQFYQYIGRSIEIIGSNAPDRTISSVIRADFTYGSALPQSAPLDSAAIDDDRVLAIWYKM